MVDHKPLPAVPSLASLGTDARLHRARLIRHFLSEAHDPGLQGRLDGWTIVMEETLDELGQSLASDDWLHNIRKARESKRVARHLEEERLRRRKQDDAVDKLGKPSKMSSNLAADDELPGASKDDSYEVLTTAGESLGTLSNIPLSKAETSERLLLLCAAPLHSQEPLPTADSGFNLIPANIGCTFVQGKFLPHGFVLYGNNKWLDPSASNQLVGGTFTFRGINSSLQHQLLLKVLRISIYIHFSLVLEQHLLSDLNIPLIFPRPKLASPSPSEPGRHAPQRSVVIESKPKKHLSIIPSGIMSFFSKSNLGHRSTTIMPILGRGGATDLGPTTSRQSTEEDKVPRSSIESGVGRLRRLSLRGDRHSLKNVVSASSDPKTPFSAILKQIQKCEEFLSTSPGVIIPPPSLIIDLAERESTDPARRLKGDEKAGLPSLLGWEGRESRGSGMSGAIGFLRQQQISVLSSQHVPRTPPAEASEPEKVTLFTTCGRPSWKTYHYYSHETGADSTLGETILGLVASAEAGCDESECRYKRHQHELRLIHREMLISLRIDAITEDDVKHEDNRVEIWESCARCDAKSKRSQMSDGTYLLSFGKFLELLVYAPAFCLLKPALCDHTTPPLKPWPSLPTSRLNIVRHFSTSSYTVSFSLSTIEHIFELRVPRLQLTRGNGDRNSKESLVPDVPPEPDEDKKELRLQIKRWWEGVADHMDKLEYIVSEESTGPQKALPRLPSSDDAYSDTDDAEPPRTPPGESMADASMQPPATPPKVLFDEPFPITPSGAPAPPSTPFQTPTNQSNFRLATMRHTFHRTEQTLYAQLSRTSPSSLNEVRRSFLYTARGAQKRLLAWQKKHLCGVNGATVVKLTSQEPEWWGKKCHVVPSGNIIVREDDWGSIISFTLSTPDYQSELSNLSVHRTASQAIAPSPRASTQSHSSFFSSTIGYRLFTSSTPQPDPDREDIAWSEPEAFSSVVSRKENPRDPGSILSIREVLRQKSPIDASGIGVSRFNSVSSTASKNTAPTPPSAWAKPDVQVSMDAAGGVVTTSPDTIESAGKILQDIESVIETLRPGSRASGAVASSTHGESLLRRNDAPSIISVESDATVGYDNTIKVSMPPRPPPKDVQHPQGKQEESAHPATYATSSLAGTLASGLSSAMRYVLSTEIPRPSSPAAKTHHGLLSAEAANIDERPHIKYDWTIGERLKFSCTVYYAKQFDLLRKRCGIHDLFLKSLSRSTNWTADGGKSKSHFWKTSDDRFIIKTLVDAWNVADLQVLIELSPSYFRYMDATTSKPTVLAKMLGFYTIEIRNLETGAVQSRSDLLVMENLFYNRKVAKTFDLKGIQGRKVKPPGGIKAPLTSKTLFDGEWIEGQQRTLMLVHPHSKQVLHSAIKSDAEFLAKSNIMDYSLLVGVDEDRKEIVCGLVDTIGSYTFAKTLEYKAKHGLNHKDVTVIPPAEYQERFISALEGYFVACPDKWSKPLDESKVLSDASQLPSVL